jgi:hypothetical protein
VKLASIGTCPRCGGFVCRDCAGLSLSTGCKKCQESPALRDHKVKTAARAVAATGLVTALLLLIGAVLDGSSFSLRVVLFLGALIAPLMILSVVQLAVRSPWPGIVGTVCFTLEIVAFTAFVGMNGVSCISLSGVAIQIAFISRLVRVRRAT